MRSAVQQKVKAGGDVGSSAEWPTLIHVTHAKAGSQWIHRILQGLAPDRVVEVTNESAYLRVSVRSGMIYPTAYVTKDEFDSVVLPPSSRRFVVIRDLRDTLVSLYFSLKMTHQNNQEVDQARAVLQARSVEEGLLWLLDHPDFQRSVRIQQSWQQSGDPFIRYEELLERDEDLLEDLFVHQCGLPVDPLMVRNVVRACRFSALTGRVRGQEEIRSHYRKGIAGDWHNYFSEAVAAAFKERFGAVLVATGYEPDSGWSARGTTVEHAASAEGDSYLVDLHAELERRLALIRELHAAAERARAEAEEKDRLIVFLHGEAQARLDVIKRLEAELRNALARVHALENFS
jgi:lipopolysaccharide transport system ATP-binding protein